MLITLRDGLDRIIYNRSMSMCGLSPEELSIVASATTDQEGLSRAVHLLDRRATPPTTDLKEEYRIGLQHWRDVDDMLGGIRARFWPEVERDLDRAHRNKDFKLIFVDGIPENPQDARVTRTSFMDFIDHTFPKPVNSEAPHEVADTPDGSELQALSRREKYTAKMLVLAARDAMSQDEKLTKTDGSPNGEAIARRWLKHLSSSDQRRGLTEDNIARHIFEGIDAM